MSPLRILRIPHSAPLPAPVSVPRPFLSAASAASPPLQPARPFSSSLDLRHGERFGDAKSDDPDHKTNVEKLKQQSVEQQKKGEGAWVPALASDSEENIKADKTEFDVNKVKEEHKKVV